MAHGEGSDMMIARAWHAWNTEIKEKPKARLTHILININVVEKYAFQEES